MPLIDYIDAIRDVWTEARSAARCDANLNRLRTTDPDAARIFTVTFTRARNSLDLQLQLTSQLQDYAGLKHQQGRMALYDEIFA